MRNPKAWADKFVSFSEAYQLEIAETIIDELAFNERISVGPYDNEKSANIRRTFERLKTYLEHEVEATEVEELFAQIDSLSDENKDRLSTAILALLVEYFDLQSQQDKEAVCTRDGHDFSEWQYHEWTSYERVCIDHQIVDNYPIEHEEWTRKCQRCGFVQKVTTEPEEVREARLKSEKAAEIKALRKRLKELQS